MILIIILEFLRKGIYLAEYLNSSSQLDADNLFIHKFDFLNETQHLLAICKTWLEIES